MSRPARKPGQQAVMIWPSIDNPYTYLNDLFLPGEGPRTYAMAIGHYAQGILNMNMRGNKYDAQKFNQNDAVLFLRSTAAAQQSNEIAFIQAKIKEIQSIGGDVGEQLQQRLNDLQKDPASFNYIEFMNIINEAILNIKNYKARLNSILHGKQHRDLERNLLTNAGAVLKTYSNRRRQLALSVEELVRLLCMRFLQENATDFVAQQVKARLDGGAQRFAAAQILLQRLLGQYINDHRPELLKKQNEYMNEDEFVDLFNSLSKQMDEYFNKEATDRILNDNQLLDEIIEQFGIGLTDNATVEKVDNKNNKSSKKNTKPIKYKEQDKNGGYRGKAAADKSQELLKRLQLSTEMDNAKYFKGLLGRVTLTYSPDRIISYEEELQSAVIQMLNGHMHPGKLLNMGTDFIGIKITDIDSSNQQQADIIAKQFADNLKRSLIEEDAANNPIKTRQIYERELDKLDKALSKLGHGFVMHETTKLYTSIEGGHDFFGGHAGFAGRNMNIINYLSSMNEFGVNLGIDMTWLRFLIYNLPNGALGSGNKAELEQILAVAAGLIMFDDFAVIAKSSIQDMQFSSLTNIHFYKLNGVYVPCSYFLHAVANTFEQSMTYNVDVENALKVEITPANISYTRPEIWEEPTNMEDWGDVREAAGATKIKMYFAANFLALISSALNPNG